MQLEGKNESQPLSIRNVKPCIDTNRRGDRKRNEQGYK